MKVFLAHGALGPLDELVMYSAPEVIFVLTMVFSWLRSRKMRDEAPPSADGKSGGSSEPEAKN